MKKIQVFYEVIRSKEYVWADEGDKKNLLDIVGHIRGKMDLEILAYCITDKEGHFLFHTGSERKTVLAVTAVIFEYQKYYRSRYLKPCNDLIQELIYRKQLNEEELVENCMELHFLPMREKLVRKPEDYWWSSYLEYRRGTGRRIVHTERVLNYLDEDRKRAMRKFVCLHNSNT